MDILISVMGFGCQKGLLKAAVSKVHQRPPSDTPRNPDCKVVHFLQRLSIKTRLCS